MWSGIFRVIGIDISPVSWEVGAILGKPLLAQEGRVVSPWRAYQQVQGFLYVEVDGPLVTATFYGDEDLDGNYGDPLDSYVMAWDGEPPTGMVAHYDFEDGRVLIWEMRTSPNVFTGSCTGTLDW